MKQHSEMVARSDFFAFRVMDKWNSLSSDVNAPMLVIFKKKLRILLRLADGISANSKYICCSEIEIIFPFLQRKIVINSEYWADNFDLSVIILNKYNILTLSGRKLLLHSNSTISINLKSNLNRRFILIQPEIALRPMSFCFLTKYLHFSKHF